MGIYKGFAWTTIVVIGLLVHTTFSFPQAPTDEEKQKAAKCVEECGGLKDMVKTMPNGDWQCRTADGKSQASSPCLIKCMEQTPDEDQNKCFCDMCKMAPLAAAFFCTGPGEGPLTPDQCDPIVCAGKGQFRGEGCQKPKA